MAFKDIAYDVSTQRFARSMEPGSFVLCCIAPNHWKVVQYTGEHPISSGPAEFEGTFHDALKFAADHNVTRVQTHTELELLPIEPSNRDPESHGARRNDDHAYSLYGVSHD